MVKTVTPQPASLLLPHPPPAHVRRKRPVNPYIGVLAQKDACMTTKITRLKHRSGGSMAYVVTFGRAITCTRGCTNCNIRVCLSGRYVTGVWERERFWETECVCATLLFGHVLNLLLRDISIMVFTLASDLRGHVNVVVSKKCHFLLVICVI